MKLRFMTYNIQHGLDYRKYLEGNRVIDLSLMVGEIEKIHPDIIGLNEVRGLGPGEDYTAQAEQMAAMLGYHCYFARAIAFDGVNPYGNAILSRFPIRLAQTITVPDPAVRDEDAYYETRCVLRAYFDQAGGFDVLVSHFGLAKSEQRNAVRTVTEQLARLDGPAVVMGDFNMEPDNEILAPLLAATEDTAAFFTGKKLSFPSIQPKIKIDYVLTKGARTVFADIPDAVASDHRPHYADILIGE